jgi:hypothetical protein
MLEKKLLNRRSFLITTAGVAMAIGAIEKTLQAAADPAQLTTLINQRVTDATVKANLLSINSRLGQFKDPSIVASWGLGCGVSCSGVNNKRWSDTPAPERVRAINAAQMTKSDRELLLSINTAMSTIAGLKGEQVGAWGLGCGAGCSQTMQNIGIIRTTR